MARQRTLTQLLEDLRQTVDLPVFSASTYITQAQATRWLNEAAQTFARQYTCFGLYSKTVTFAVTSGVKEYPFATIAPDFAALQNLTFPLNGDPQRIRRASDIDEIDMQAVTSQGWSSGAAMYTILGENLIVTDPKAAYTVTMRYCPELPVFSVANVPISDLSAGTDYILEKGCIADWLVQDAACKVMRKQQIDPGPWFAAREELGNQLKATTLDRDAHNAEKVRNTWSTYDYAGDVRRGGGYY